MIRDGKVFQIPNLMQTGKGLGMRIMDESILELLKAKAISDETALATADNETLIRSFLGPKPAPAAATPANQQARRV
jgi:twitching motility protein PilT